MHQLPCIKLTDRAIIRLLCLIVRCIPCRIWQRYSRATRRLLLFITACPRGGALKSAPGDRESKVFQQIDAMHEELKMYREEKAGRAIPEPKFKTGQSVLQWWSSWMKSAAETPLSYNKKNRPAWFSAEICSYNNYGTIRYAGQLTTSNLYNVY